MENLSDKQLVSKYLLGEKEALEVFYDRYEKMLYYFILKKVRRTDVAEDLFQEIWIKVLDNLPKIRFMRNMKSWLFRISMNHIIDYYRRQKSAVNPFSLDNYFSFSGDKDDKTNFYSVLSDSKSENPREVIADEERRLLFHEALRTLPPEMQEVVLLRTESDFKFKDIAQITRAPLNTVLSRMRQAVIRMTAYIQQKGGDAV